MPALFFAVFVIVLVLLTTAYVVIGFAILDALDIDPQDKPAVSAFIVVCWPIIALFLVVQGSILALF